MARAGPRSHRLVDRGRLVRIAIEAAARRQGQRSRPAGSRRRARSHRRTARGDACGRTCRAVRDPMKTTAHAARNIAILGATGSIGASTLDVVAQHPERFTVTALAANRQWQRMLEMIARFRPVCAALLDPDAARELASAVRREAPPTRVLAGSEGLCEAATLPAVDTPGAA